MALKRARRKANGLVELPEVICPRCRTRNLGVRSDGVWSCWKCARGGRMAPPVGNIPHVPEGRYFEETSYSKELSGIPVHARKMIERRGFDAAWLESQYRVRWDGERLHWPCGAGASLRAIWPWECPKTLTVPPRGLIGQHLLHPGADVVLTEGDWKSGAIPRPWLGIGHLGGSLSEDQALIILSSRPASITIMEDGGCWDTAQNSAETLAPFPCRIVCLPIGCGPDDIPRGLLFGLLGGWIDDQPYRRGTVLGAGDLGPYAGQFVY